jgi:hypothetical protein
MAVSPSPTSEEFRRGYRFWFLIIALILGFEVLGSFSSTPWTTISTMVGNLEDRSSWWAVIALAAVAITALCALRSSAPTDIGPIGHSSLGRWQWRTPADEHRGWYGALFVLGIAGLAESLALYVFDDRYQRAYFIYGAVFLVGIVIPSILAILGRREAGFPSLFVTVSHLRSNNAWWAGALTVAIAGGLAILAIHLAFYPWPDLAKENVKYAGLEAGKVRSKASQHVADLSLVYSARIRGIWHGREAWRVYFLRSDGKDSKCVVTITQVLVAETGKKKMKFMPTPSCSR